MRLEKRYPAYRCWATRIWRSSIRTMTTLLKKHLLKLLLLPSPHLLLCQNPKFLSQFPLRYHSTTILDLRCSLLCPPSIEIHKFSSPAQALDLQTSRSRRWKRSSSWAKKWYPLPWRASMHCSLTKSCEQQHVWKQRMQRTWQSETSFSYVNASPEIRISSVHEAVGRR